MKTVFCFYQIYVAMKFIIDGVKACGQLGCLSLSKRQTSKIH